jgi:hypothetical protein
MSCAEQNKNVFSNEVLKNFRVKENFDFNLKISPPKNQPTSRSRVPVCNADCWYWTTAIQVFKAFPEGYRILA